MSNLWTSRKGLIVVRTYPVPAKTGVEVSCTAAISDKGEWLRLFPMPYRYLADDQRFKKYQWIQVDTKKASDARPESYKINADTLKVVSDVLPSDKLWQARKQIVYPLKSHCLCCLKSELDANKRPTLGFFKPASIQRLIIEDEEIATWTQKEIDTLRQGSLFDQNPKKELEKIPYKFLYQFKCDEPTCNGHTLSCTDWEMGQSWRKWRDQYGDQWEGKFRLRYEDDMICKLDTHFFVGTLHQHPKNWIIIGLFYPPIQPPEQQLSFEL